MSDQFMHPLQSRYVSEEMLELAGPRGELYKDVEPELRYLFSLEKKGLDFKKLWCTLARVQLNLGLNFDENALKALEACKHEIDLSEVARIEKETRHDVMAFMHEYKNRAEKIFPGAGGILHAGATSCFVADNQELLTIREALRHVAKKLDPEDQEELLKLANNLKARGTKGTTGTMASYLELYENDENLVLKQDELFAKEQGFQGSFPLTGQTYPRSLDYLVVAKLWKISRKLGLDSVGKLSSMACSLAVMAKEQWMERTLDDSAQRRIVLAEAFFEFSLSLNSLKTKKNHQFPIQAKKMIELLEARLADILLNLERLAIQFKDQACLAYTHYQVAQPTTFGKRLSLWNYSFYMAYEFLQENRESVQSDESDCRIFLDLLSIAAGKFAVDMRLLQHEMVVNEPFGKSQVGSSAMAYKKNPMKCERICALTRTSLVHYSPSQLLDQSILTTDAILILIQSVLKPDDEKGKGFTVHTAPLESQLKEQMPFLVSERLIMEGVLRGGDRQELHEIMRVCMLEARSRMDQGESNPFLQLLCERGFLDRKYMDEFLNPSDYTGLSSRQVEEFSKTILDIIREDLIQKASTIQNSEVKV